MVVLQGTGLSPKECEICDFFVYIPQYGGGTASLNVTVAASIILHHFAGILINSTNLRRTFMRASSELVFLVMYCLVKVYVFLEGLFVSSLLHVLYS